MKVGVSIAIPHPAADVWSLAGGFDLLPAISTNTACSRLEDGGRLRVLVNRDGSILWERMLDFDDAAMTLAYEITDAKAFSGAYGRGYRGRVTIESAAVGASLFRYEADFEPAAGVSEAAAKAAVEAFAADCAAGIGRALEAGTRG
ncbi:SRPBCC family protein [Zavarzinia aquatilis]|uniref:SRPBCC family protein n=1 Tax=Zavarzinia aquatilis TaxID=2211142 RepID=A0A317E078_9PROT|nr:SRPBCC family protein [Zavarzinia aquatilis]PWR19510.1 hypothetical protein DKG74_17115 [Zavarzinia aquatilis]